MRTTKEIVERFKARRAQDFMGFEISEYLPFMPFKDAKPFLKDEVTEKEWGEVKPRDAESVKAVMLDYMPFAWEKANNRRGISAWRSLAHMQAWLWLIGESDEVIEALAYYSKYGKPELRAICERYGWDWKQWDDGRWTDRETEDGGPPGPARELAWGAAP